MTTPCRHAAGPSVFEMRHVAIALQWKGVASMGLDAASGEPKNAEMHCVAVASIDVSLFTALYRFVLDDHVVVCDMAQTGSQNK